MTSKQKKPQAMFNRTEFSKRLPTLSLNEVMKLKFKIKNTTKWEFMAVCKDQFKKQYLCNVCSVFQYGDKNLIQHLTGKKHFVKMESIKQVYVSKETGDKIATKESTHLQKLTGTNNRTNVNDKKITTEVCDLSKMLDSKIKPTKPVTKEATKALIAKPVLKKTTVDKSTDINASKTECTHAAKKFKSNSDVSTMKSNTTVDQKALSAQTGSIKKDIESSNQIESNDQPDIENKTYSISQTTKKILPISKVRRPESISGSYPSECSSSKESQCDLKESELLSTNDLEKGPVQPDGCSVKSEVMEKNKTTSASALNSSSQSNIVKNPFALRNAKETKISCVPISKLISIKQTKELKQKNVGNNNGIKVADPFQKDDICCQKEDKINKMDSITSTSETEIPKTICASYIPTNSTSQSFTFESALTNSEIMGLLGVEYVIKIVKNMKDKTPRFQCSLCDITADEISMQNHLLGYNHRLKYCEKHFPTAIRQYRQYISNIPKDAVFKVLSPILEKLAKAIEKHHGRETAYLCYEYPFNKNRTSIISTVFNRKHASEEQGPSFTHVVGSKDVDFLIVNAHKSRLNIPNEYFVSNDSSLNLFNNDMNLLANQKSIAIYPYNQHVNETKRIETVDDETHKRMVEMFLRDTRRNQPKRHRSPIRNLKRSCSKSSSSDRKRIRAIPLMTSQWDIERKSLSPLREGDIWQAYRHMVDQSVRELNASFDLYISDPEQHPLYKKEWQTFWKRRKDELIAAGINHRAYNYQNEWILFFNARLEELYKKDIENIKLKCRERLCLPMTNVELSNSKYHVHNTDNDLDYVSPNATVQNNRTNTFTQHKNVSQITANENDDAKNIESTEDTNVIHVLRLLTALEDHLGSLGPSITELLAKALQMFKLHPDKANILLLTSDNCAILETAKEKFTGLIISKILEPHQERAVKKAINDTEQLLKYATNMQTELVRSKVEPNYNFVESKQKSLNSVNTKYVFKNADRLDKTELAAKLASSLISQGKTKINQEQLQQIVQVYSLIEQQKHQETTASSRPINVNYSSPVLTFQPNTNITAGQSKSLPQNTNFNSFDSNTAIRQTHNLNYNNNCAAYKTSRSEFSNSAPISGTHNFETVNNYLSANMACTNNTNVLNFNQMEYIPSGQDVQYHQYNWDTFDIRDQTGHNVFNNDNKRNT